MFMYSRLKRRRTSTRYLFRDIVPVCAIEQTPQEQASQRLVRLGTPAFTLCDSWDLRTEVTARVGSCVGPMDSLDLVTLRALMECTNGTPDVKIGLTDGPIVTQRPACLHGTFLAGILSAKRNSPAPLFAPTLRSWFAPFRSLAAQSDV